MSSSNQMTSAPAESAPLSKEMKEYRYWLNIYRNMPSYVTPLRLKAYLDNIDISFNALNAEEKESVISNIDF